VADDDQRARRRGCTGHDANRGTARHLVDHLQYRGVHVVGVDSFTVGAGDAGADIRLESVASTAAWSVRVVKRGRAGPSNVAGSSSCA